MRPIDEVKRDGRVTIFKNPPGVPLGTLSGLVNLSTGARASFMAGFAEGGISEHVSVELYARRLPTWAEMCEVKDIFWDEEEEAIQIHPKKSEYVNISECLHLWRPVDGDWNRLMREGR